MYIGSTGPRGLHHLVYEVVDNSVDEALAGYCDSVRVVLHPDNSCTVIDNGRGIPVEMHGEGEAPAAEVVLTTSTPAASSGTAAATRSPAACTASASPSSTRSPSACTWRSAATAHVWTQDYERGKPQADARPRATRPTAHGHQDHLPARRSRSSKRSSSTSQTLAERLRETAFLTRGLKIELVDERAAGQTASPSSTRAASTTSSAHLNENKDALHRKTIFFEGETEDGQVEVAMQWNSSYQESIFSFANNINTHEGGTHLSGFRSALTRTLNAYARGKGLLKEKDENLTGEDVREGLTAVISVKLHDPQFEGQTKTKLGNPPIEGLVEETVNRKLGEFFEENPGDAQTDHQQGDRRRARPRGRAQGARPDPPQVGAGELDPAGQARRLHRQATRPWPSSSSSRATPPAARPSRGATATPRRCCRCAARSSTSRRAGSTRSSPTTRSRR